MRNSTPGTYPVAITIDVEDHGGAGSDRRFGDALQPLLDGLEELGTRATFFVVGELAPEWSSELGRLAAAGHEIGLHGYTHRFLAALGPTQFAAELARGATRSPTSSGARRSDSRAPYFSLTSDTPWAPELIRAAGFCYSSSVLPAWNPQAGLPGAPKTPFRWPEGLVEFPSPVYGVGRFALPVLGGAYVRLVPQFVVKLATRSARRSAGAWSYSHPYDFDVDEQFTRTEGQPWIVAKILFARRRLMLDRILGLARDGSSTLGQLTDDATFMGDLPTYSTPVV